MKHLLIFSLLCGALISSCTMPDSEATESQIGTAAALTVQAALAETTPLATPTAGMQPTPSVTAAVPTFSPPMASVQGVTNCRKGPGTNYERVTQIMPRESVKIVGFFPPNYWVVSTKNGDCWLSGEFVTPSGSFAAIPTVAAPPTPQGGVPDAATFPKNGWTFYCYGGQADITLSWNDNANNESGYRILRDGAVIAELPPNSAYFEETIILPLGKNVEYKIRAYNLAGEADRAVTIACQ